MMRRSSSRLENAKKNKWLEQKSLDFLSLSLNEDENI